MALTPPKVRVFLSTFSMLNVPPLPERSVVDAGNWDLASNNPRQRSRKFPSFLHRRPRRKEEEGAITDDASSERINYCCSQFDALWGQKPKLWLEFFCRTSRREAAENSQVCGILLSNGFIPKRRAKKPPIKACQLHFKVFLLLFLTSPCLLSLPPAHGNFSVLGKGDIVIPPPPLAPRKIRESALCVCVCVVRNSSSVILLLNESFPPPDDDWPPQRLVLGFLGMRFNHSKPAFHCRKHPTSLLPNVFVIFIVMLF